MNTAGPLTTAPPVGSRAVLPAGGDSGGPLVREIQSGRHYELAGVMSVGSRICGSINIPLLFTRVEGEVNKWIRREVGQREIPVRPAEKYK